MVPVQHPVIDISDESDLDHDQSVQIVTAIQTPAVTTRNLRPRKEVRSPFYYDFTLYLLVVFHIRNSLCQSWNRRKRQRPELPTQDLETVRFVLRFWGPKVFLRHFAATFSALSVSSLLSSRAGSVLNAALL